MYKSVLTTGEEKRMINSRIASTGHQLQTVVVNKRSLSAYDDKRYILSDGITTLPYGHEETIENTFFKQILADDQWGLSESGSSISDDSSVESLVHAVAPVHHVSPLMDNFVFSPTDPGLHQREYSESELEQVVDLNNLTSDAESVSESRDGCAFVFSQAEESEREDGTRKQSRKRKKRNVLHRRSIPSVSSSEDEDAQIVKQRKLFKR